MASKHDYSPTSYTEQALLNHIAWYADWGAGTTNVPNAIAVCNPDGTKIGSTPPVGTMNVDPVANTIGLATAAKQDTGNTTLSSILAKISSDPATETTLAAIESETSNIEGHTDLLKEVPKQHDTPAGSTPFGSLLAAKYESPLTTVDSGGDATILKSDQYGRLHVNVSENSGLATSAHQITGNTSLASIDGKLGSLGQKTMTGSAPVVISSDQSAVPARGEIILLGQYLTTSGWSLLGTAQNLGTTSAEGAFRGFKSILFEGGASAGSAGVEGVFSAVSIPRSSANLRIRVICCVNTSYFTTLTVEVGTVTGGRKKWTVASSKLKMGWNVLYFPWEDAVATNPSDGVNEQSLSKVQFYVDDDGSDNPNRYLLNEISISYSYVAMSDRDGYPITSTNAGGLARAVDTVVKSDVDTCWLYAASYAAAQANTVVKAAPGAGKRIRVKGWRFSAAAAQDFTLQDEDDNNIVAKTWLSANGNTGASGAEILLPANKALEVDTTNAVSHSVTVWGDVVDA